VFLPLSYFLLSPHHFCFLFSSLIFLSLRPLFFEFSFIPSSFLFLSVSYFLSPLFSFLFPSLFPYLYFFMSFFLSIFLYSFIVLFYVCFILPFSPLHVSVSASFFVPSSFFSSSYFLWILLYPFFFTFLSISYFLSPLFIFSVLFCSLVFLHYISSSFLWNVLYSLFVPSFSLFLSVSTCIAPSRKASPPLLTALLLSLQRWIHPDERGRCVGPHSASPACNFTLLTLTSLHCPSDTALVSIVANLFQSLGNHLWYWSQVITHPASYPMGTGGSFPRNKATGVELTTHLHLVPRSRIVELYLHSPIHLHGVMLNCLIN
jgi:hypothetical protein